MYRLVLYYLIVLIAGAAVLSFFGILQYNPWSIILTTFVLLTFSLITNKIFSEVFAATTNLESTYITALILALIINPIKSFHDLPFLFWAAILAISSKYILAIRNKHIFNPVAVSVVLTSFGIGQSASWWVGNVPMLPLVFLGGLLIIRKTQKDDMIFSFVLTAFLATIGFSILKGTDLFSIADKLFLHSSLFFFAFVMLTEPLTTPPTKILQIIYGALVGFLFVPDIHLSTIYSTPELALIVGNVFSYLVSPKEKLVLKLKEKIQIAKDTFDFVFPLNKRLSFIPGQYMEWTIEQNKTDSRGNRRYFTLASSPTEDNIRIGVKFEQPGSSFKKTMLEMDGHDQIVVSQLAGDFTLPKDQGKYVFIAGGIGITPYRSMIKYLIDTRQKKDIILLYTNRKKEEIVYKDIFDQVQKELGIKVIYALTDLESIPADWQGRKGRIDRNLIEEEIPDYKERIFYISGSLGLITGFKQTLKNMGVAEGQIKTDFFPGFV